MRKLTRFNGIALIKQEWNDSVEINGDKNNHSHSHVLDIKADDLVDK